jgi:ATP-binding cassette subfamily F protein 3
MRLLETCGLAKDWDGTSLFEGASFAIEEGEKLGLVGRNGSGKTSLLCILAGLDEDYRGVVKRKPGLRVGYAPQRFEPEPGLSCGELLAAPALALETRLDAAGAALATAQGRALERALESYATLRAEYERFGAEEAVGKACRLLDRMGLAGAGGREAARLSGGEKNVLSLALALMGDPDLLILDEPGNHLDFWGLEWLEAFLRDERRAVLMVSHNRWLLDRTVDRILELEGRHMDSWSGGYSAWRIEKLRKQAGQGRDWEADRRRVERLEALVRRFAEIARSRPDPAWGARLRARKSQLEREKAKAAERPVAGGGRMEVVFRGAESKADFALNIRGYDKAYGDLRLFKGASLDLLVGERAALVGPNGCGKTSLLRDVVASAGSLDRGALRVGPSMRIGYCAQEQETFAAERRVGEEFAELGAREADTRRLLGRFGFDLSAAGRRIGELSGGEVKRLEIARACFLGANFLVLDEPTNHLDIEGREALEEGLADFPGTIFVVSHDRWFLEKVADRIIMVEGGKLEPYEGGFSEYWRDRGRAAPRPAARPAAPRRIEDRGKELARSRTGNPGRLDLEPGAQRTDRNAVLALEARIAVMETEKQELEAKSTEAMNRGDFGAAGRLADKAAAKKRVLDRLYEEWAAMDS